MNRKLFADRSGIVVDVCREHGTFFDVGELPAIIKFVLSGGLTKASSRKTADRIPIHKQPDNFAKTLSLARAERPREPAQTSGAAFVELLFALFI
jgi:hypothetical protein